MFDIFFLIEVILWLLEVCLDVVVGVFLMFGESYLEDVSVFFGFVFNRIFEYFDGVFDKWLMVDMWFIYFNFLSVKVIMNLF